MMINGAKSAIFLINLFLLAVSALASDMDVLVLKDSNGDVLLKRKVDPYGGFAIRYTHSVALTPVVDYFLPEDGLIRLVKTEYQDFGAGLPHNQEAGQKMYSQNGKIIIEGYQSRFPVLDIRVGRVANHILLLLDRDKNIMEEIPLSTLSSPGSAISFSFETGQLPDNK